MTKITKIALLLVISYFTFGCAHKPPFYYPSNKESRIVVIPDINVIAKANLGVPIIRSGSGYYADGIVVKSSISYVYTLDVYKNLLWSLTVKEGFYEFAHDDSNFRYFYPIYKSQLINKCHDLDNKEYVIYNERNIDNSLKIGKDNSIYFYTNTKFIKKDLNNVSKKIQFDYVSNYFVIDNIKNSFQQTLIYTGKMGNVLKFSYREFSDDLARPAFSTDISYDLTESKIIGYKDFKAEIIEATNTELIYKILQGF